MFWYHDARQLDDDSDDGRCTVTQRDDGLCRLRLINVQSHDAGNYVVVAVNNEATCKHAFLVTVTGTYSTTGKSQISLR